MLVIVPFDGLRKILPEALSYCSMGTMPHLFVSSDPHPKGAPVSSLIVHAYRMNGTVSEVYGH